MYGLLIYNNLSNCQNDIEKRYNDGKYFLIAANCLGAFYIILFNFLICYFSKMLSFYKKIMFESEVVTKT